MKKIFSFIWFICIMTSCVYENVVPECVCDEKVMIGLEASVEGHGMNGNVKSILDEAGIEDKLTDITLASYDPQGILTDVQYYTDLSDLQLYISKSGSNKVFALANMGDMTAEFPSDVEDVVNILYKLDSYDEVAEKGIPMCASMMVSSSMSEPTLRLVRLFAKVNLRILHTSLDFSSSVTDYAFNLCNLSMYVRQANTRLYPFSETGSRAMSSEDIMSQSDYNPDLNDRLVHPDPSVWGPGPGYWQDTTVVVYVPENRQGILLPSNTDPYEKSGDNISSVNGQDFSGLCTYIELNARKEAVGTGLSGGITYRCYLGADNTTDFNVERNGRYDVTMDLTQESFGMDCWKVSKGEDWTDTRSLQFLADSYVIYPGTSKDVFVHYSTSYGLGYDSQARADQWKYSFDDDGMAAGGLLYSFDPAVLKVSPDSKKNFCFTFTASESAAVGKAFPLTVMSNDGSLIDESMIYISEPGELTVEWDRIPLYIAQYGVVNVHGAIDEGQPLSVTVSDPSVVRCTAIDGDTFRVVALKKGNVDLTFSDSMGIQHCSVSLSIDTPKLKITTPSIALNPDGAPLELDYSYIDSRGMELSGFDPEAFRSCLFPVVSNNAYFTTTISAETVTVMISSLYDETRVINTGSSYELILNAINCPEAGSQSVSAYVIDPFDDIMPRYLGRIDDYTLFALKGVDKRLSEHFRSSLEDNRSFVYEAPVPAADKKYVTAGLIPEWNRDFSYGCGVYSVSYNPYDSGYAAGASFSVEMGNVTDETEHSAGRHKMLLYVQNRHSGEKIEHLSGYVDIYVHAALGARAEFGSRQCSYKPGDSGSSVPTFAEIYNELAGRMIFYPQSSGNIYYMDVKTEFLTDVRKVLVYDRLLSGAKASSNAYDAVNILQPSVADGQTDINTQQLFSVSSSAGDRIIYAGEEYGGRKGIGVMLYRAIRPQTYDNVISDDNLYIWFFGLNENDAANPGHAPCYDIHDMTKGTDMALNKVSRAESFYFAPSSYPDRVDNDGKGYHVIHFLEEIAPETCGWINLL